jgi:hypothetical protein
MAFALSGIVVGDGGPRSKLLSARLLNCDLNGHFELIAPPGSGKGDCLEIPNLCLGLRDVSVLSIDKPDTSRS